MRTRVTLSTTGEPHALVFDGTVLVLSGAPGTGKSMLAERLHQRFGFAVVCGALPRVLPLAVAHMIRSSGGVVIEADSAAVAATLAQGIGGAQHLHIVRPDCASGLTEDDRVELWRVMVNNGTPQQLEQRVVGWLHVNAPRPVPPPLSAPDTAQPSFGG